jgi:hypothetical protein
MDHFFSSSITSSFVIITLLDINVVSLSILSGFFILKAVLMMLGQANTKQTPKRLVGLLRLEEDYKVI